MRGEKTCENVYFAGNSDKICRKRKTGTILAYNISKTGNIYAVGRWHRHEEESGKQSKQGEKGPNRRVIQVSSLRNEERPKRRRASGTGGPKVEKGWWDSCKQRAKKAIWSV